jgi:uncharacterized Ntn-hydrolase superfamily protein
MQVTFSILGRDSSNGDLGVAVQSKFPGVGSLVPYGQAEVGVVATQAFGNPRHGSLGLTLLECGASPQQAIDVLTAGDIDRHRRQFALLDGDGASAAYTGAAVADWDGWAGSTAGEHCISLGNGLAGSAVAQRMVDTFEASTGPLAERLMTALDAGHGAGGDLRGQQSAALLVLRRGGGYGGLDDRHVVISVYDHPHPIAELMRCYGLHRLAYFPSDPANLVAMTPELAIELKTLMTAQGGYAGPIDDKWDLDAQRCLDLFLGRENYDNRIDNGGLLDLEVLADLRLRYAAPKESAPKVEHRR